MERPRALRLAGRSPRDEAGIVSTVVDPPVQPASSTSDSKPVECYTIHHTYCVYSVASHMIMTSISYAIDCTGEEGEKKSALRPMIENNDTHGALTVFEQLGVSRKFSHKKNMWNSHSLVNTFPACRSLLCEFERFLCV